MVWTELQHSPPPPAKSCIEDVVLSAAAFRAVVRKVSGPQSSVPHQENPPYADSEQTEVAEGEHEEVVLPFKVAENGLISLPIK